MPEKVHLEQGGAVDADAKGSSATNESANERSRAISYLKQYRRSYRIEEGTRIDHFLDEKDPLFDEKMHSFSSILANAFSDFETQCPDEANEIREYLIEHPNAVRICLTGSLVFGPKRDGIKQDLDVSVAVKDQDMDFIRFAIYQLVSRINANGNTIVQAILGHKEGSPELDITQDLFNRRLDLKRSVLGGPYRRHL